MTVVRVLIGLINAILRAASSSFLVLGTMLLTAVALVALAGFVGVGLTGAVSLRLSRRRTDKRDLL